MASRISTPHADPLLQSRLQSRRRQTESFEVLGNLAASVADAVYSLFTPSSPKKQEQPKLPPNVVSLTEAVTELLNPTRPAKALDSHDNHPNFLAHMQARGGISAEEHLESLKRSLEQLQREIDDSMRANN